MKLIVGLCLLIAAVARGQQWQKADMTNYNSYPECCENPNAEDKSECEEYNGCEGQGYFAYVDGKQSKSWVRSHNIIAIHEKFERQYKLKTLEIRSGSKIIRATVYDKCSDEDCNGCCTRNMRRSGFLIDMEHFTQQKFGVGDGVVEWRCVDC